MAGRSIRERLSPRTRSWLALLILLAPITLSFVDGLIFQLVPKSSVGKMTLDFEMVGLIVLRWLTVLPAAFYLLGFREILSFLCAFKWLDIPFGIAWHFAIRGAGTVLILPVGIVLALLFPVAMKVQAHRMLSFLPLDLFRTEPLLGLLLFFVVSMVAGFCEESWRLGMFRVFGELMPKTFASSWGKFGVIFIISVIFGSGHVYEGITGCMSAVLLGLGLGCLMIYGKTFWQAAIAHFCIDFGSGVLLCLIVLFHLDKFLK